MDRLVPCQRDIDKFLGLLSNADGLLEGGVVGDGLQADRRRVVGVVDQVLGQSAVVEAREAYTASRDSTTVKMPHAPSLRRGRIHSQ